MIIFFEIPIILILVALVGIFSINIKIPLIILTLVFFVFSLLFAVSSIFNYKEEDSFGMFLGAVISCFLNGWLFINAIKTAGTINLFVMLGWLLY